MHFMQDKKIPIGCLLKQHQSNKVQFLIYGYMNALMNVQCPLCKGTRRGGRVKVKAPLAFVYSNQSCFSGTALKIGNFDNTYIIMQSNINGC